MQGQSSVNFFDIYNKKRNQGATGTPSGSSAVSGVTNNTPSYTSKYTKQMEDLDKDLMAEGLKIEKLSDDKKRDYVNSLSETEYQRLNQYRDAGYSFGASKALLDLERQRTSGVGGARSQGYQIAEPIGGQESALNKANFIGYLTEKLDNRLQEEVVPRLTVSEREKRASKLWDKYKNMTDADWDKLYKEFVNDPKAKTYDDDSKDYTLKKYWIEKNTDRLDDLFSVGDQLKVTENADGTAEVTPDLTPGGFQILANAPASTLATASAVLRGVTNPVDNLWMITQLLGTKEGRGLLADRYLSREGASEAFEKDPIGRATDLFDLSSLLTKGASSTLRGAATAQRLAGYKDAAAKTQNAANRLGQLSQDSNTVADLGISDAYDRILNKALARLSQGGKVSNAIGDYVSLTQQPLRTIWKGAGGINPKTGQPYNQTTGRWTFNGLQPALNKVWDSAKEKIQNQATGLTPEVRERIRQNPFIKEYRDRIEAMLNEQGAPLDNQRILEMPIEEVGQELLRRLDEYEASLEENGSEYQALRQTTRPYNFTDFMTGVYEVFAKNGITVTPDGELTFATTANPADMNPVNIAWNVIKSMEPNLGNMTIAQLLDFRKQLRSLINYESDSRATRFSKNIIRQIVDGQLNKLAHKEIPSLAKVDEIYSKQINELKEFKDGLVYQQGEKRGQIKDNFYSIISTINTQNRQRMKARLEKIFPDLGARVEAIRMLPILAKTYQNSPKLVNNMLKTLSALTGVKYSKGPVELALDRILGIIADELISKPLGEKWRKVEIRELLNEMSPEAQQKLAEIKSKIDAGVALSEQEKQDLATAMQEIAQKEYEYLDEKHQKEFDKIMESANNQQPKLPQPGMDTIGPDGTIKLGMGNQLNSPEEIKPKTRDERIQEIQAEGDVTPEEAEEITNGIEDFLDEIGADIEGNITPGEVNYDRFSTRVLEELMEDKTIPRVEKDKIGDILARRSVQPDSWEELDQKYAYKINKLMEEEQRIGKVGKNKVKDKEYAAKQMREWEKKKERLIEQMSEDYGIDQFEAADKYTELEQKGPDYIKQYKKSKRYAQDQAELEAVNQLRQKWSKQPEFTLKLDQDTLNKRKEIISNELKNGYEWEETPVGDRFTNGKDKGAIKYNEDGTIDVVFTENGYRDSGVMDILPDEAWIRFEGEPDRIQVKDLRGESEYQTVGRANPNERDISAEEGMETENYKGNKTVRELADDYGLEVAIVDKIFTEAGEEALGRAKGNLIELVKEIKEGTAPHEVFHPIFNMVNGKRRAEIIDLVRKNKGMTEKEAKEWLADNFSEYFRTGKFDTKPIPKGFVNKVKWFFNKVKEFLNGTRKNRKKIQKLFDDIMDGKISVQKPEGGRWEYQLKDNKPPYDRKLTPEQKKQKAVKMFNTWDLRFSGFDNEAMINYFDTDLGKWMDTVKEKAHKDYPEIWFVDYYLTLKALQNDPDFVEGLSLRSDEITKPGNVIYGTNNLTRLDRLFKNKLGPLKRGDGTGEIRIANEKLLEPIRRWLMENDVNLISLKTAYSPDTIQRQNNLRSFDRVSVSELKKLQKYVEELYEKGEEIDTEKHRLRTPYTIIGEDPNMALYTIGMGVGETFTDKRIKKLAKDMWSDVLDPMGDIFKDAVDRDNENTIPFTPADINDFYGEIYNAMGKTYSENVKARSDALEQEIKKLADHRGLFLKKKKVVPEAKLQNLAAKLKELLAVGPDVGEYLVSERERDYNPTRSEWIRDLVNGAYENSQKQEAKKDIETTKQLVAISNIDFDNFKTQIEKRQGKNPMPSIAITDVNVPHTAFGDISLIFGRETVDPQVDPRNVIFASDAWTQTFPDTETAGGIGYYEATELMQILKDKINKVDKLTLAEGGLDPSIVDTLVNRIANEIMSNGQDAEYLAGYFDVAETSVENAVDEIGLERADNEGLYLDLENIVEDYVKNHQIRQVIPARYFKGKVRYQDFNAINEIVDRVYDNLPEKGKQKLKDDGWNFDETDSKYVINQKYNDAPPKQGLERDLMDVIEKIENRPNNTPTEAGREYRNLLVNEYGFDRSLATQISEDIFGQIEAERLTPEGFAEKLSSHMPLNDGDMGFDFGEMYDHNLEDMNFDIEGMNRQVGRRILEERDEQKQYVDGPQAMNKILDTLLDEREENTHEIIENYVTVDLREKAIGDDPTNSEENEWRRKHGEKDVEGIMGGVDASLTDMKLWVKDVANQEMLIEGLNRDRPLTPENVLEAMKGQGGPRRDNAEGTLRDLVGVEGKRFTDIEQVREKNLAKTTHNDRTGDLSAIEKRYNTIVEEIRRDFAEDSGVDEGFSVQVVRQEIAWNYDPDLETFRNNLEEENPLWEMIPDDYLQGIIDTVEMGKQVPVRFSESKPERVVDMYKEVKYILAPREKVRELNYILRGTPLEGKVHEYNRADFKDSRSRKLKQIQRKYGDVFFSFGGAIMPIAMLLLMMQQEDEGQA